MKCVAITGISGYIGTRLLSKLVGMEAVDRIIGVDIRPPAINTPKLKFYRQDISQPLGNIFKENEADSAIHLVFILNPNRNRNNTHQVDVGGSINFLKACEESGVKNIIYLSSHTVYGAHPDNPVPIKEDQPLRPLYGFQYSWDKVETEKIWHEFTDNHPERCVTILRGCPVVGPNAADSIAAHMFKPAVMIGVRGFDPPMQFVHEDDLIDLMSGLIAQPVPGIYNVANDGEIKYSEIARTANKKIWFLPESLIHPLMAFAWNLHLQNESPPVGLEFIKYPPVVSTEALKTRVKFRFHYSSKEAIVSYLQRDHKAN